MKRGLFAVYKPPGKTSADVVREIKHVVSGGVSGRRGAWLKVGHGGTLDRDAEGVLAIGVGKDCKRLGIHLRGGLKKVYVARGQFGTATDTFDASGHVVESRPCSHVTRDALVTCLRCQFTGEVLQRPPVYSALKIGGQHLSDLARAGQPVPRPPPRPVTIQSVMLDHFELPHFTITVTCLPGVYVRSIIHDLGIAMATCAHMTALQRTRDGPFELKHCLLREDWTIEKIKMAAKEALLQNLLNKDGHFPSHDRK